MTFFKLLSNRLPYRKIPSSLSFPERIREFILPSFRQDYKRVFTHNKDTLTTGKGIFTFSVLLALWFITNLLQSIFTQIANDEAYYWLFSENLDWGYFDHPPMIALWIHAGNLFFSSELGVRFIVILMQLVSLIILWKTIDDKTAGKKNILLFFGLAAAIPLFEIYGFIATPDAALLFFTALFLFAYKHFLSRRSLSYTVLLGITMACLMYSKYHGALVILLTIASNHKLLISRHFIFAGSIALLLFLPHINWQIVHEFPTLQFQMTERFKSFRLTHFLEYLPYQLLAFNPFVIGLLLYIFLKTKFTSPFQHSLFFITTGFLLFFWLLSFWVRPEPHWTAAASVPAIILLYKYTFNHSQRRKYVFRFIFPSLLLILFARLIVIFHITPVKLEFHGQKEWAYEVASKAETLPVAFINSYQKASVYTFYTGNTAFSINNVYYRRNQFDLWAWEQNFQHQKIATLLSPHPRIQINSTISKIGNDVIIIDTLSSTQRIKIDFNLPIPNQLRIGQEYELPVVITNPFQASIDLNNTSNPVSYSAMFCVNGKWIMVDAKSTPDLQILSGSDSFNAHIKFTVPDIPADTYKFGIGLRSPLLLEGFNSSFRKIEIVR